MHLAVLTERLGDYATALILDDLGHPDAGKVRVKLTGAAGSASATGWQSPQGRSG
jgi:hypothetical protein